MFDTIGDRITYCRSLLRLARNEMAKEVAVNISLPTLARWELNTVSPSLKKIQILADFFVKKGIDVSAEWLKKGEGYPPISLELNKFDVGQFDELAYSVLIGVRNKIRDFYFQQVTSNFLRPIITFGDYIGGVSEENHKSLDNKLCFLYPSDIVTAGIYHHNDNALVNLSGEEYVVSNHEIKIGEIQWIIRRP